MNTKPTTGQEMIAHERDQQIKKGYTAEHDDKETRGQLAWAAALYAAEGTPIGKAAIDDLRWPWPEGDYPDKRGQLDRIRQLVIAGALIAAEIDRLHRIGDRAIYDAIMENARLNENPDPDNGFVFMPVTDIIYFDMVSRLCDEDFRWSNLQTQTGRKSLEMAIDQKRAFAFFFARAKLTWTKGPSISASKGERA